MFPNIPKRTTAIIQVWVSILLIVLALIMSFMPIIKVNTEDLKDSFEELAEDMGIDSDELELDELPDYVEFTAPKLITSGIFFADLISTIADEPDDDELAEYLEDKLEEGETQEALTTAFAMVSVFTDNVSITEFDSNDTLPVIFGVAVSIISFLYIIIMILVLSIILIIKAIVALVQALMRLKNPEEATAKVSSKLTGLLGTMFIIMLFQCALPQVSYAWGAIAMMIITTVSIVLNAVAVRLPAYYKEDMMFANVVQGVSLVGIIGFLVFFFNLIKTGILETFIKGPFFTFVENFDYLETHYETNYKTDAILMILYVVFAFIAVSYISGATRRLSLSAKNGSYLLAFPILALPVFILPTVIKSSQNLNIIEDGEVIFESSSLYLSESGETALIFVLVGIIIMLLAEIAYIVLPKVLCKEMTKEEKLLVLSGNAPDPEAKSASEKASEKASTEESAEQAPAGDTVGSGFAPTADSSFDENANNK